MLTYRRSVSSYYIHIDSQVVLIRRYIGPQAALSRHMSAFLSSLLSPRLTPLNVHVCNYTSFHTREDVSNHGPIQLHDSPERGPPVA